MVEGETHNIEKVTMDVLYKHASECLDAVAASLVPDKQTHTQASHLKQTLPKYRDIRYHYQTKNINGYTHLKRSYSHGFATINVVP